MPTIAVDAEESEASAVVIPLTREQAQELRLSSPSLSPWWVVMAQGLVGLLVSAAVWMFSGKQAWALSVLCGAIAVVFPAAIFARGVTGRFASVNAGSAVLSFFVWELVKIVLTVGVLLAAHRWVVNLSWPAMIAGLLVTMKVYWLALAVKRKPQTGAKRNA